MIILNSLLYFAAGKGGLTNSFSVFFFNPFDIIHLVGLPRTFEHKMETGF
jgi:hypothetical protein